MKPAEEHSGLVARAAASPGLQLFATAAACGLIYLVWTWPLASQWTTHSVIRETMLRTTMAFSDQGLAIALAGLNADSILDADLGRLIDQNICWPMPKSATLGEHGIELGILGVPVFALTQNPIAAYNSACLLIVMISGASAFWLIRYWTGSGLAGFTAALMLAFNRALTVDLIHPYISGLHWIPLILYLFERLVESKRWRHAILLGIVATLQCWVGAYPLLSFAFFVGSFGVVRLIQQRRSIDRRLLLLLAAAVAIAAAGAFSLLIHYVTPGDSPTGIERRQLYMLSIQSLLHDPLWAVSRVALALSVCAVLARGRRLQVGLALLAGIVSCLLISTIGPYWPGGPTISAYIWLTTHFPAFGIVRAPMAVMNAVYLGIALLGGIGFACLMLGLRRFPHAVPIAAGAIQVAILTEALHPDVSERVLGLSSRLAQVPRAPDARLLAAYARFDEEHLSGPVLDLPYGAMDREGFVAGQMARYWIGAAHHQRPTPACEHSHMPASHLNVKRMADRLPAERAVVELAAAGLTNLVVHHPLVPELARMATRAAEQPGAQLIYASRAYTGLHLEPVEETTADPAVLELANAQLRIWSLDRHRRPMIELRVVNTSELPFATPHPIEPITARVRWRGAGDKTTEWREHPLLLPLGLAPGAEDVLPLIAHRPHRRCDCRAEFEIPALGWRLDASEIESNMISSSQTRKRAKARRRAGKADEASK